jgi:hypothetical protein
MRTAPSALCDRGLQVTRSDTRSAGAEQKGISNLESVLW